MSRLFVPFFLLFAAGMQPLLSQTSSASSKLSAVNTLRAFGRERGDVLLNRIVGVVGFHGQDQPAQWMLLQADLEVPGMLHEYGMQNGRIVAQRRFSREPGQDLPSIPINLSKIAIDSPQAFALANQAARKSGIGFDSMNFQLRCRDLRNEPVWVLNLMDNGRHSVGLIYLSAVTGETLRTVWNRPGMMTSTVAPAPAPARDTPRGLIPQLMDRRSDRRGGNQPLSGPGAYAIPGGIR